MKKSFHKVWNVFFFFILTFYLLESIVILSTIANTHTYIDIYRVAYVVRSLETLISQNHITMKIGSRL
jgi:hypothetical protein